MLPPDEITILIDYARQKFAEERYPLAPAPRPVRDALASRRNGRKCGRPKKAT